MDGVDVWLAHSDVFNKHWVIESKPWVRNLGWFEKFADVVSGSDGWVQTGNYEFTPLDYINIIEGVDSETKIYWYSDDRWTHINIPLIFVIHKDGNNFIVGWAGPKELLKKYKKESDNPWDWPDKLVVEVDPLLALYIPQEKLIKSKNVVPVFFCSNGETNADENWNHLVKLVPHAIRIDGVDGRRKMFHRCVDFCGSAKQFFVVTGKNYITDRTVFDLPVENYIGMHTIFYAKNMSNRLEYGHMGVVLYDKELVLNTPENFGLDFTQYSKTQTIPRVVSEAVFATTSFEAWRTAFRETVKLTLKDDTDSEFLLNRWLAFAEGDNSDWVLRGAEDGHQFALENKDDMDELRNSENWEWLLNKFNLEYNK